MFFLFLTWLFWVDMELLVVFRCAKNNVFVIMLMEK